MTEAGGVSKAASGFRFEIRVARQLHDRSPTVQYEPPTGGGGSKADFLAVLGSEWLIELTDVDTSYEIGRERRWSATSDLGVSRRGSYLGSDRDHQHRNLTPEGESMRLRDKVINKAMKFPTPADRVHVILVQANSFQLGAADIDDWLHLAYGNAAVREEARLTFQGSEVGGSFAPASDDARILRERVHLVGFARERDFVPNEIAGRAIWARNPELLATAAQARDLLAGGPLAGGSVLNPPNFR